MRRTEYQHLSGVEPSQSCVCTPMLSISLHAKISDHLSMACMYKFKDKFQTYLLINSSDFSVFCVCIRWRDEERI
jgi:hypothetical protein